MQQTVKCICGNLITGHGYWLNLRLSNPLYGCPKCKVFGKHNFKLVKSAPDEVKVLTKNEDNELISTGDTATKITRFQRERAENQFKAIDFEHMAAGDKAKRRARSKKILNKEVNYANL